MTTQQPGEKDNTQQQGAGISIWWIALAILLAWNLISLFSSGAKTPSEIPYSVFLDQVRANNVARVHILGDQIHGTLKNAVTANALKISAAPVQNAKSSSPATPSPSYRAIQATIPTAVGDTRLLPLLESHDVLVDVSSPETPWYLTAFISWLPMLLFVGLFVWLSFARGQSGAMSGFGKIKAKPHTGERITISFKDVAGVDAAKGELQEEVDFLRAPEKYRELGARIPRGILLVGPPGTGKTLLARAVAGEAGVPFFSLNGSEFVEMFVGVGASRVRDLFTQAKAAAPAIIFIDELDAVGRRRGAGLGTVNDEREQTLNQLLGELDGFDDRCEVIVLAATNRPDVLDPALLRPGRFDRQVVVEVADRPGREGILRIHASKLRLSADVDLAILAQTTIGLSGADLANLCNEAALTAARRAHDTVMMADFNEAQDKLALGVAHPQLMDASERRVVAYHESGHALIAWLTVGADPVQKVTIIPHGQALGLTQQVPDVERHNLSRPYLEGKLAVLLAGRATEEIVFGEITTGAENDLVEATSLARRMVTRWGMSELGLLAFKSDEQQPFLGYEIAQGRDYSEATAAHIDREVHRLLEEAYQRVRRTLAASRDRLEELAQTLLRGETIAVEQLNGILGPRAQAQTAEVQAAQSSVPAA